MKIRYIFIIISFFTIQLSSQTNFNTRSNHPFSGKFALSLDGGITYSSTDFKNNGIDYLTRASFDYYIPSSSFGIFGIKIFGGTGYLAGEVSPSSNPEFALTKNFRTMFYMLGAGANFSIAVSESVIPYISGGVSYFYFEPKDKDGNELIPPVASFSPHKMKINGETGIKFLISKNFGINIGAGINYINSDQLDGYKRSVNNDIFFSALAGFTYYFSGIKDQDGDGIQDDYDQCPDTKIGVIVDEFGCPVDSDRDNVPDFIDKCPNTPANVQVDVNGCPVDLDKDGIPDYLDLCNDTPLGVPVDDRGCSAIKETTNLDLPKDVKFSEDKTKIEFIWSNGIFFEIGRSELLTVAYHEMEKVLIVMRKYPDTKWRIEGYTDNTGNYYKNMELSSQRARSVYNYFVSNGIDNSRLKINSYGQDYPLTENRTVTERTLNRRVSIVLISDENIKNISESSSQIKSSSDLKEKIDYSQIMKYNPSLERNVGKMIFTDGTSYCFQVSSFRTQVKAQNEAQEFRSRGYNSFVVEANLPELNGIWYRVRIGYFESFQKTLKERSLLIKD